MDRNNDYWGISFIWQIADYQSYRSHSTGNNLCKVGLVGDLESVSFLGDSAQGHSLWASNPWNSRICTLLFCCHGTCISLERLLTSKP